jgi:small neutral amino acid transporter SnatA (MarC family)
VPLGAPSSIGPGTVSWTWQYTETGGQPSISATLTLAVSGR